ncbi:hypothetical protein ACQ4PT_024579 [Festuca glaucescens]
MDAEMTAAAPSAAPHLQQLDSPMRPQVIKFCYRKRPTGLSRNGKDDSSQDPMTQPPSSPLSRQSLSTPVVATYHAGGFYEIDHGMLPPRTPIHLKSIRVVKVSEYTSLDVTVSFPSLLALRSFFSSFPAPSAGPELDERFVMSSNHAARILGRRVAEQELEGEMHQDSFWLVNPCLFDFSASSHPANLPDALSSPEAPPAQPKAPAPSCRLLATLKCDGAGWGVRRRIRYIGRHRDDSKEASIGGYETEASVREQQRPVQQEDNRSSVCGKRKRDEAESNSDKPSRERRAKKTYKSPKKQKKRHVESKDGDPRRGKERWSAERYAAAERSLLEIMRSSGARLGAPVMRQALRDQARKRIGDTGLLDHLLKHMAGRVPDGSTERFRRRHNADGAMEYWLEPADLAEVRREAGVSDPYWVPPPGWKPGDDVSPVAGDLLVKRQVEELAEELNDVKRHMEQLSSNMVELGNEAKSEAEQAYSSWKEKYQKVVKANEKIEKQVFSLKDTYENVIHKNSKLKKEVRSLKDKYEFVVEKNDKLEEQMASLSSSFLSLKEQFMLSSNGDKLKMAIDQVPVAHNDGKQAIAIGGNSGQTSQRADVTVVHDGEKRTTRKSNFCICKPQGTFLWPSTGSGTDISGGGSSGISIATGGSLPRSGSGSCPGIGPGLPPSSRASVEVLIESPLDEHVMVGDYFSTPPSASSSNATKLLSLPSPRSPLKPQPLFSALHSFAGLTLRHMDSPSSLPSPCGASLLQRGRMAMPNAEVGGISTVGTELALATPFYC